MRIQNDPPLDLTYCLNVHPGESWQDNLSAIEGPALAVRRQVCPDRPFGLGLRLSRQAAQTLSRPDQLRALEDFLRRHDLYVFTINGFPYGQFHGTVVKEDVYRPDWATSQRRDYTILLANILAALLPEGQTGSISTVPGSYKRWVRDPQHVGQMCQMLAETAMHLAKIRDLAGKDIALALEPEPDCFLETTAETIAFLAGPLLVEGAAHLQGRYGLGRPAAQELLRRHVGVCFDTAHLAVQFEDLAASLRRLRAEGIAVSKIQLSSALTVRPGPGAIEELSAFQDGVYLHQVRALLVGGGAASFRDLPEALAAAPGQSDVAEWRVHFHVPLFFQGAGHLGATSSLLTGEFA